MANKDFGERKESQADRTIKISEPIPEDVSLYLADGYLSAIHPKNFHGWFYVCDKKGRIIRFVVGKG